jgi:hypothetical protein
MSVSVISNHEIYILKQSDAQQKSKMIVTVDGSLYEDNIWSYNGEIEQRNVKKSNSRIKWDIDLGNGSYLTDSKYAPLLNTVKDFILSLRIGQTRRSRVPKATTVI